MRFKIVANYPHFEALGGMSEKVTWHQHEDFVEVESADELLALINHRGGATACYDESGIHVLFHENGERVIRLVSPIPFDEVGN